MLVKNKQKFNNKLLVYIPTIVIKKVYTKTVTHFYDHIYHKNHGPTGTVSGGSRPWMQHMS